MAVTLTQTLVLGQGGAMAIEDAICIARLLPPSTPTDAIQERLQMFESLRYKHVEFVRDETRRNGLEESQRPNSLSSHQLWGGFLLTPSRYVSDDAILLQARRVDEH
jgi:2-polyprenyl-6-methoxyphenol hydroxylase-like FAD-dependent oxidoreductase